MDKREILSTAGFFRLAYYKTAISGEFLECDDNAKKIFGIPHSEADLSMYSTVNLYEVQAERDWRIKMASNDINKPRSDAITINVNGETKLLFDVIWCNEEGEIVGLVREMEESNLLRSYRAIKNMPTGFYYVEHAENDHNHKLERLTQCNDWFLKILGLKNKNEIIGKSLVDLLKTDRNVYDKYFDALHGADSRCTPLQNYQFETKSFDTNRTLYLSIDAHLVKNSDGKVIGREGTIRDISEEVLLRKGINRTTKDINNFIHTFLHPVVKFSGFAQHIYNISTAIKKTAHDSTVVSEKNIGTVLLEKLEALDRKVKKASTLITPQERSKYKKYPLVLSELTDQLTLITNIFSHTLHNEKSRIILDQKIKETALWLLIELDKVEFKKYESLVTLIGKDFIEFLHSILFDHIINGIQVLMADIEVMKREVESLRSYIGLKKDRKHNFSRIDLGDLLQKNIERFRPLFHEKEIDIIFHKNGNLKAMMSPNDIDRVINNLLLNAKKYAFQGPKRFIRIEAKETENKRVEFSIESLGLPIKRKEIRSGYIFKHGNRSELAIKSDRTGTGIGLADASDTVSAHGGKLIISSEPIRNDGDPPRYAVPYKTIVTIELPREQMENGQ